MNLTMWRCRIKNCHAFVKTADGKIIQESGSHIHEPLPETVIKRLLVKEKLRKVATDRPDEKPAKLISNVLRSLKTVLGVTYDGDVSRYRKLVRCSRRKVFKSVPKTKTETFNELRHLAEQKDELIRSVERDIVMIAREADLRLLSGENLTLFADGTFQYSPKHFKQMLTIFTLSNGYYIPICHFLLQN